MEYILIPSHSKSETAFLLNLFKKMQKETTTLSSREMEDIAFAQHLKKAETTSKGSLEKVKAHLEKVSLG